MKQRKNAASHLPRWNETRPRPLYVGIVTLSAFFLFLGLGWSVSKHLVFGYHDASGVVGWIHVHQYPKHQELFYYLLALLGTPALICGYAGSWRVYSHWVAKTSGMPIQCCLKAHALASVPLCLSGMALYPFTQQEWMPLILPSGLSLLITFGFLCWSRRKGTSRPELSVTAPLHIEKKHNALDALSYKCTPLQENARRKKYPLGESLLVFYRGLAYLCLPVFIYLLTYRGKTHGGIDLFHEGELLAPLNEMLRGGIPFRDIYIQHGLFENALFPWLGSQLFEPTLRGVRMMREVLIPLGYIGLYFLCLQVFRARMLTAFLCVLITSGPAFYVSPRHALGLLAFAFVANAVTHRHNGLRPGHKNAHSCRFEGRLVLAGFFTSGAFWYSTEIGLYSLASIGLFLGLFHRHCGRPTSRHPNLFLNYTSGVLFGLLPVSFFLAWHGALDDAIRNTYIQCRYQIATWGRPFPSLSDTLSTLQTEGWQTFLFDSDFQYYLPVCVFLSVGAYLTYRALCRSLWQSEGATKLLLLWLGGITFFRTALGRTDPGHLAYGSTFFWLLCLLPIEHCLFRLIKTFLNTSTDSEKQLRSTDFSRYGIVIKSAGTLTATAILFWYVGTAYQPFEGFGKKWERLRQNPFTQQIASEELDRTGDVDIPTAQVQFLQKVLGYIQEQTAPDEKIFDFSSQGASYFFANRPSVTRYHQIVYAATPAMQREVIDALEADRTRIVLFKTGGVFDAIDGVPAEKRHPIIAAYLRENYEPARRITHRAQILQRKKVKKKGSEK